MSATSLTKSLAQLGLQAQDGRRLDVTGVSVDSRYVRPGHLFVAVSGVKIHGAEFISYALRMGATAILTDAQGAKIAKEALDKYDPAVIIREDARMALAFAASNWFNAQPEKMVAVTGTNGKTSVANFTRQIWSLLGYKAVNFGTAGLEGALSAPLTHTTPEPVTLHALLAELARQHITHGAMEASSHGLEQRRLDGVELTAAAFTNFSQDHLDYHESFDDYFDAKSALFTRVLPDQSTAVINMDDRKGSEIMKLSQAYGHRLILVGEKDRYDICLKSRQYDATGQNMLFTWLGEPFSARLNLIGGFQAQNVLLAAGLVIASGAEPHDVFATLGQLVTVRGRMQHAATRRNGATVFVDYAHTPDAISTALQAMRPHVMGRLVTVIGAGGDRDKTKRTLMGAAAKDHADVVFVTDDNPRTEDPAQIREMVMQGCPEASNVGDRAEAILRAVDALGPGDALLIAGKGHETGQVVGDDILPFDDVEQASLAVAALEGRMG